VREDNPVTADLSLNLNHLMQQRNKIVFLTRIKNASRKRPALIYQSGFLQNYLKHHVARSILQKSF